MAQQIGQDIKPLITLAEEQGWTVEPAGQKIRWKPKDGGVVFTSTRVTGRGIKNVTASLARAGLVIPGHPPEKPGVNETAMVKVKLTDEDQKLVNQIENLIYGFMTQGDISQASSLCMTLLQPVASALGLGLYESTMAMNLLMSAAMLRATGTQPQVSDLAEIEELREMAKRLEKETLEAMEAAEHAGRSADKAAAEATKFVKEKDDLKVENAALLERALKAERKLTAFRTALSED